MQNSQNFQKSIHGSIIAGGPDFAGRRSRITLKPAPADHGVWLQRKDLASGLQPEGARQRLTTSLKGLLPGVAPLLAALEKTGVDNILIELDGPELPLFDDGAAAWTSLIRAAGLVTYNCRRDDDAHLSDSPGLWNFCNSIVTGRCGYL